jgi:hypothetical protein
MAKLILISCGENYQRRAAKITRTKNENPKNQSAKLRQKPLGFRLK